MSLPWAHPSFFVQSLWLDFICPLLRIEDILLPPRETLAFRAFAKPLCPSSKPLQLPATPSVRPSLYPASASLDIVLHRHMDGLPNVGKKPLRPMFHLSSMGTIASSAEDPVLMPFRWRPGVDGTTHPLLGDAATGAGRIRLDVGIAVHRLGSPGFAPGATSLVMDGRGSGENRGIPGGEGAREAASTAVSAHMHAETIGSRRVPPRRQSAVSLRSAGAGAAAPSATSGAGGDPHRPSHIHAAVDSFASRISSTGSEDVLSTPDLFEFAASIGLAPVLPLLLSTMPLQPLADPNDVLRAATLLSSFHRPALPVTHERLRGAPRSAAQQLAAAERRVLWLAVPEMWRFDESDELARYSDEVRVRHRLALLADDMEPSVFDVASLVCVGGIACFESLSL
jgi:hypothetical protein